MSNETNLNAAQNDHIFSGKGGRMKEKRGLFNISIVALVVWFSGFSLTPSAMGVESITNINLSPPSPAALLHNEYVDITFDYAMTHAGGAFIFTRPFTNGSKTPNCRTNASPLYPTGEGGGTGYFTIDTGDVVVDQIRFQMKNADFSVLLHEFFIDVEYHFSSAMGVESITNINLSPPSPAALLHNEYVDITFDYAMTHAGGAFIFTRPFTNGSKTPNCRTNASPLYPTGEGGGTGYFTIDTGDVVVDQIRFQMKNADFSVLLHEFFIDVEYHFSSQPVEVPNVVGLALSQAEQAFWSAGFTTLYETYAHNDTVPQGHVIGQEPAGGELVPIDSSPMIIISLGPDTGETTVEVPDVVGMSESDAASEINSAGLSVGSTGYFLYSDTVPDGCVISQSPGAGTEVNPGTVVDLVISMGPEPEDVPPVPVPPVPVPPVPVPPVPVEPDASCLLAHWKLDDGSGNTAIDSSDNGFDITLHNTSWEDGVFDGAVHFHAVGYGDVSDFNHSNNTITVCAWVYHDEFRIDQIERYVTVGPEIAVIRKEFDGRLHFYIDTGGNYFQHLWVDDVLTLGQWHHVAGTWDGLTQRLYIDGVEIASQIPGGVLGQTSYVMISSTMDEPFNGMLDDVRIYDCALDENQINYLISVPPEPVPPAPTPSSDPLSEALDTSLSFTTGGSADWFSQTTTFYYDGDAAQSGDISGNQESWMQTTVSGKGTVKFYWMVSSEEKYDCLEFYIDGVLQEKISGFFEDYWVQKTYTISTSGSHTLEWRYIKDGITDYGSDCGCVDKVEWLSTP